MTGGYEMYWISDEEVDVDFHEEKKHILSSFNSN